MNFFYIAIKVIILSLLLSSSTFSGTTDGNKDDSIYLNIAKKYKVVHRLHSVNSKNQHTSSASCVLIKDQWIMTAAHVVELHKDDQNFVVVINGKRIPVEKFFLKKEFTLKKFTKFDIALGKLSVKTDSPSVVMSFEKPEVGSLVTICGYGGLGNFDFGVMKNNDGKLRCGFNRIDSYDNHSIITSAKIGSILSSAEYLIVGGDSGGGVFYKGKLVAINSFISSKNGTPRGVWNNECGHISLFYMKRWINTIIAEK